MMHQINLLGPGRYRRGNTSSCPSDVVSAWPLWSWSPPYGHLRIREVRHEAQWTPMFNGTGQQFKLVNLILNFIKYTSKPKVYIEAYFTLCILPLQ